MKRRTFLKHSGVLAALPLLGTTSLSAVPLHVDEIPASGERGRESPSQTKRVNGARLNQTLASFNSIGRTAGGINRLGYSDADLAGRAFALDLIKDAGMVSRIDAAGNIYAEIAGSSASLKPILIGSHIDSVTDGGNYDGPVGAFAAIEVARSIREQDIPLRHPVRVVVWQNEEGGTIGSKLAIGDFAPADLDIVARSGKTLREGIALVGGNVDRLNDALLKRGDLACYIELHIEQGGSLEKAGLQIGVVEGIVGLRWFEITITGFANHAGATPMDQRQDAMLAAAKFTVAVNDAVTSEPGRQVATIGRILASPNTINVIPGQVVLTVDLRDLSQTTIDHFDESFKRIAREIGVATGTTFEFKNLVDSSPAIADENVMTWIERSAIGLGLSMQRMPSGAGHDAQEIARIAPMGMIFVPSVGGISHSPKEFSKPDDITNGANVLLNAVIAADAG